MQCLLILLVDTLIKYNHKEASLLSNAMFDVDFFCSIVMKVWEEFDNINNTSKHIIELYYSSGMDPLIPNDI